MERCSCGDPACPWCGTAQGYDPEAELEEALDGDEEAVEAAITEGAYRPRVKTPSSAQAPETEREAGANAAAQRAKAHRAARLREVAEANMDVITPRQAVEQITEILSYYKGQVWTREMAEERARNLVCWLQLTRIVEAES